MCDAETCWQLSKTKLHLFLCSAEADVKTAGEQVRIPAGLLHALSLLSPVKAPTNISSIFFPPISVTGQRKGFKGIGGKGSRLSCRWDCSLAGLHHEALAWLRNSCHDPLLCSMWSSSPDLMWRNGLSRRGTKGGFYLFFFISELKVAADTRQTSLISVL